MMVSPVHVAQQSPIFTENLNLPRYPMPKSPKADAPLVSAESLAPAPILIPIAGGDSRLPQGLHLGEGVWYAEELPDGRIVPQGLPPAVIAAFYPDLVPLASPTPADPLPPPPSVEEL